MALALRDELHATLKEMLGAIGAGQADSVAAHVRRIDQIGRDWNDAPAELRHYLEKHSYAKALDFLEGRDEAAAPNC